MSGSQGSEVELVLEVQLTDANPKACGDGSPRGRWKAWDQGFCVSNALPTPSVSAHEPPEKLKVTRGPFVSGSSEEFSLPLP